MNNEVATQLSKFLYSSGQPKPAYFAAVGPGENLPSLAIPLVRVWNVDMLLTSEEHEKW
jgi:hypothetical protein